MEQLFEPQPWHTPTPGRAVPWTAAGALAGTRHSCRRLSRRDLPTHLRSQPAPSLSGYHTPLPGRAVPWTAAGALAGTRHSCRRLSCSNLFVHATSSNAPQCCIMIPRQDPNR